MIRTVEKRVCSMDTTKKPTLLSLRQRTRITTQDVAQKAGVSLTEAYIVEIGGFADRSSCREGDCGLLVALRNAVHPQ